MIDHRTNVVTEGPARKFARGLPCLLLLASPLAWGDVALYQAAVPLKSTAEADRATAFGEALKIAAVRASGRRDAGDAAAIAAAAADPSRYVQQYSTTADRMLKVGFDGRAMEQLLQQAGLPLWPSERPTTTVLLFVPAIAGGARAVTAAERPPESWKSNGPRRCGACRWRGPPRPSTPARREPARPVQAMQGPC